MSVSEYKAWVTEEDGIWFIELAVDQNRGNPIYDFCWGGEAEFLSNSESDRSITAIRIYMNRGD
jgi:hypothetical protein